MAGGIPPGGPADGGAVAALLLVLELHRQVWAAPTAAERRYHMVNHTRRLVPYRQAAFLALSGPRPRLEAVSGVAVLDPNAPFVRWLEAAARAVASGPEGAAPRVIDPAGLPAAVRRDWSEWAPARALWCPLAAPGGPVVAALWLSRDEPWTEAEILLLSHLAAGYGCAWWGLAGRKSRERGWRRGLGPLLAAGVLTGVLAVPVPLSTLAPAEIQAAAPLIVAAPLDGVIERFHVRPNEPVTAGQPLFRLDDTVLRSRHAVAAKALAQAEAEVLTATQAAFADPQTKARVAQLRAQADLRRAELALARDLLDRVTVTAERGGIAVFTDVNDWLGRPVVVGERVLTIADPAAPEITAFVPVGDALILAEGAPVELFLNTDPLHPLRARLTHASYEAGPSAAGVLSYKVKAALEPGEAPPRIGLRGTAKIGGERVPLALYLFRRPLAALRQTFGF